MKIAASFILYVLLAIPSGPELAVAKDRINWLKFDYPPMYIVEGDEAGQGYMDNILDLLTTHMPGYEHSVRVANLSRIMSELEQGNDVCIASLFVNEERKRLGWISRENTTFLPPVQLVFRAEDADKFSKFGSPASLLAVIRDQPLILGVSDRMSYGKKIDAIVAAHSSRPNVFLRKGKDVGLGLHEMLLKRRIDYTVNYPWAATYTAGPDQAHKLKFLPFDEAGQQPVHHVICTKNDLGKRIIDDVDKRLRDPELTRQRREYILRWLPDEGKEEFLEAFNAHFGLD